MIQQAISSDDPIVFFEPKRRYWEKGAVEPDLTGAYPLHASKVVRAGSDATVLAYGPMVRTALDAAAAAAEDGRELEVIDLRTLSPLDLDPVFESVRKTGRCVVVHEAAGSLGLGAEIAARVTEHCFYSLEAPVLRVTGYDIPYPAARVEEEFLPDLDRVLDAVDRSFGW
jgi:pyruvate dehydrogenase E1 component beta subunit